MSQLDYNLKTRKNKHLNERERYKIEVLLKEKMKPSEIAKRVGRSTRTIQREVKRGTVILDRLHWIGQFFSEHDIIIIGGEKDV